MTKKEILDYITETPGNTNRAVLGDMLDSFEGGSGGGGAEPLIVKLNVGTLDKTWQEIYDAFPNVVFDSGNAEVGLYQRNAICRVSGFGNEYQVVMSDDVIYKATSTSGYPKEDLG